MITGQHRENQSRYWLISKMHVRNASWQTLINVPVLLTDVWLTGVSPHCCAGWWHNLHSSDSFGLTVSSSELPGLWQIHSYLCIQHGPGRALCGRWFILNLKLTYRLYLQNWGVHQEYRSNNSARCPLALLFLCLNHSESIPENAMKFAVLTWVLELFHFSAYLWPKWCLWKASILF